MRYPMPLVEALEGYIDEDVLPFHMPGHKMGRGFTKAFRDHIVEMDVTEIPGVDDLHAPQGPILEAERLASRAFGAMRSFFLVNGSTSGIYTMLMGACKPGDKVIVPRNCHKSVWGAMVLGDIRPVYIQPEYDYENHLVTQITPASVEAALSLHPDVVGMILTHPNYYGMCSDIGEIARILHEQDKILMVDEAHGAHFYFSSKMPPSSAEAGADIWVQSAHKTLPAFTQSAYLHVGSKRIEISRIIEIMRIVQSSSPSYMLMASLDYARAYMENEGAKGIDDLLDRLLLVKGRLKALGLKFLDQNIWDGVKYLDPSRLVIDTASMGMTGYEAEGRLRRLGIQVEMSDLYRLILICSVSDDEYMLNSLGYALTVLYNERDKKGHTIGEFPISFNIPEQILSPREAFYSIIEKVPLSQSEGRVCAGMIGAYPPGIPKFCPGERIDGQGIAEIFSIKSQGGNLFGLDNGDDTIPVVKDLKL